MVWKSESHNVNHYSFLRLGMYQIIRCYYVSTIGWINLVIGIAIYSSFLVRCHWSMCDHYSFDKVPGIRYVLFSYCILLACT